MNDLPPPRERVERDVDAAGALGRLPRIYRMENTP
jgi:hypothetical protein